MNKMNNINATKRRTASPVSEDRFSYFREPHLGNGRSVSLFVLLLFVLLSCSQKDPVLYDGVPRIYFPEKKDSLSFSFGDKLSEYKQHTLMCPVRLMGSVATRDMKFRVALDPTQTTAKEGVHFKPLSDSYTLHKDSINAYIPIELYREHLDPNDVEYKIVLTLLPSEDFQLGAVESLRGVVTFNDYLEEPSWWQSFYGGYAPTYHPGMYRRIIAYYGHPIVDPDFTMFLELVTVLKREVYDYAQLHPELNWTFSDNLWWPFND